MIPGTKENPKYGPVESENSGMEINVLAKGKTTKATASDKIPPIPSDIPLSTNTPIPPHISQSPFDTLFDTSLLDYSELPLRLAQDKNRMPGFD